MPGPPLDRVLVNRVALATLIAVSVAGAGVALAVFRKFILLVLLGLVFTEVFQAIADPLHRRFGGPRSAWIGVAVLIVLGTVAGLVAICLYPLQAQLSGLFSDLPALATKLAARAEKLGSLLDGAQHPGPRPDGPPVGRVAAARLADVFLGGGQLALYALEGFFEALAVVFLGVFVAATPRAHKEAFLLVLPERLRPRGRAFVATARRGLRNWMLAIGTSMGIMGCLATFGLWLIGVPYFLVFGIFAGAMELVPYLGPVLAFAAPTILCLATDPAKAVQCGVFYCIAHGLEANVIIPLVVRNRAHISPSLVVLSILFFGSLAGVVGLIGATPLLAIGLAALNEFWLEPRAPGARPEPLPAPAPARRAA